MSFRPRNRVKKKRFSSKFEEFLSPNQVKTKNKGLHRNLRLNSAGICGIYLCCLAIFCLFNQSSNLDGSTLNLDRGTLILDGGTHPPFNYSTEHISRYQKERKKERSAFFFFRIGNGTIFFSKERERRLFGRSGCPSLLAQTYEFFFIWKTTISCPSRYAIRNSPISIWSPPRQ